MIKASDAIRVARSLIGTPYAELDCINLIKKVIRTAPGGVPGYTTAGTNALWKSYDMSAKYKDLTWRQDGLAGAQAGMIAFKADGADYHHAGIVTDVGTVIHSSSTQGGRGVVETPLTAREGWTHLAVHRYIEAADAEEKEEPMSDTVLFKAEVMVQAGSYLSLREDQSTKAMLIEKMPKGAIVEVLETTEEWWRVRFKGETGWAAEEYLSRVPDSVSAADFPGLTIIDGAGRKFYPTGGFTVVIGQESID